MEENWNNWIEENKNSFDISYEREFVRKVLTKIRSIEPSDVIPQFEFRDSLNKKRRIDFYIKNNQKGYSLAIELDGTNKDTNHKAWGDFLSRQNDLLEVIPALLRFSNKQLELHPVQIINRIETKLEKQQIDTQIRRKHIETKSKLETEISEYQIEIASLKNELKNSRLTNEPEKDIQTLQLKLSKKEADHNQVLKDREQLISDLKNDFQRKLNEELAETQKEITSLKTENETMNKFIMVIAAIAVAGLIFLLGQKSFVGNTQNQNMHSEIKQQSKPNELNSNSFDCSRVDARNAHYCINESTVACGPIVQIKRTSKSIFLNFYKKYPNNPLTLVIWENKIKNIEERIGNINDLLHQTVCASGLLESYKDSLQIEIENPYALRLMRD